MSKVSGWFSLNKLLLLGMLLGIPTGLWHTEGIIEVADTVSDIVINLLKLISLPIIFCSLVSTISGMEGYHEMRGLGKKVLKYTLTTTVIAATVAFVLFIVINPVEGSIAPGSAVVPGVRGPSYFYFLRKIIPPNLVQIFIDNNVVGALFLALLFSLSILALPKDQKKHLHDLFSSLYAAVGKMTNFIAHVMPFGVWAFVTMFIKNFQEQHVELENIALYVACVIAANLIQGLVVLPILLKIKGLSPTKYFRGVMPALTFAFFSKSSTAALPVTIKSLEKNLKVSRRVGGFALPLCTTINMNGCAAFIFTTVLFVSMTYGVPFTMVDKVIWIFIATIAAFGNAGIPMGCYFMSSAFLAAMNVPLELMGIILPIYTLIDMIETALNVWSDVCVTVIVDKETDKVKIKNEN